MAHVELTEDGDRIVLRSPYYAGVSDDCKKVVGYKYDPETKSWTYPLRMQTCTALRTVFGKEMTIGPRLTAWARTESLRYKEHRALASKPDSELARVKENHPDFWERMNSRPYQRSGAEFLAYTGTAAEFDEPGLGKTAIALAALDQADVWEGRHLVVVSNKTAIQSTWAREIRKWTPDAKVYPMPDGRAKREAMLDEFWEDEEGARFLIILPHMLQIKVDYWCSKCKMWLDDPDLPIEHYGDNHKKQLKDRKMEWPEFFEWEDGSPVEWDSVIADECHDYLLKVRPGQAKQQPQWAHGMRRLTVREGGCKLPMTGTPFRGKEQNIFGILHWMDPKRFSTFWGWAGAYFEITDGYGQSKIVGKLRTDAEPAFFDLLDSLCLRRTRAEVRNDLPMIDPQEHWVPLEGEHKRQYQEFEEMGVALLEDGVIEGMGTLSEMTRLRQLAFGPGNIRRFKRPIRRSDCTDREQFEKLKEQGKVIEDWEFYPLVEKSPKIELMNNMLRERGAFDPEPGMKYIIASQYTRIIDGLKTMYDAMGVQALVITGAVTGAKRNAAVDSFTSEDGPKILLMNTKAGGASLTLDAHCDEMFILDETWIHDDQVQLMGRINNRGERIAVRTFHFFRTEETVDEGIALSNDEQNTMQSRLLDARRGNQVALSLLRRRAN
jgi:SNF2 family DNA or RNA helicase